MRFKETEEKEIGCNRERCPAHHLSCCYSCPANEGCKFVCELFLLHSKQPMLLEDRQCSYLKDAKVLVFKALLER